MKMTTEHYNYLFDEISKLNVKEYADNLRAGNFGEYKNFEKRLIWDLVRMANLTNFICDNLYSYLNDNHIETGLKTVVKNLNLGI